MTAHLIPSHQHYAVVGVEVDASTVRRDDQVVIGGQALTVADMTTLPRGAKRLHFASGETLTMRRDTVLWVTRRFDPRLRRRVR
ncbi:hypothetical protein [Streptomyces litchfieldiae]|uniref:Uncharacterized protein n=1 Tax=Streptomyces litchfieldiae TaxID=3075543 RepID=A0ABU2MU41_9ACTN|nr:hypothetical protein [Streptomyces sp. DSM 44938]MDT0345152.1 hypothetical protein [Streptomyces sp. DSM 44938]